MIARRLVLGVVILTSCTNSKDLQDPQDVGVIVVEQTMTGKTRGVYSAGADLRAPTFPLEEKEDQLWPKWRGAAPAKLSPVMAAAWVSQVSNAGLFTDTVTLVGEQGEAHLQIAFRAAGRDRRNESLMLTELVGAFSPSKLAISGPDDAGLVQFGKQQRVYAEAARAEALKLPAAEWRRRFSEVMGVQPTLPAVLAHQEPVDGGLLYSQYRLPTQAGSEGRLYCLSWAEPAELLRPGFLFLSGHFGDKSRGLTMLAEAVKAGFVGCFWELHNEPKLAKSALGNHRFGSYYGLVGQAASQLFVQEADSALSVISKLPGVDPARIGLAGASYGGTMSVELAALRPNVAAAATMSSTVDFYRLSVGSSSDAEQHPIGFAKLGGMEGVVARIAPRPLLLMFAKEDPPLGIEQSQEVVATAKRAYEKAGHPERLEVFVAPGHHDEAPSKRQAFLKFMSGQLNPPPSGLDKVPTVPATPLSKGGYRPLLSLIREQFKKRPPAKGPPVQWAHGRFEGRPQLKARGGLKDALYQLPASDPGEETVTTSLWRLSAKSPRARILVLDDWGRRGAGFALGLRRCGVEVFVGQPRLYGRSSPGREVWRRQAMALTAASLGRPLAPLLVRDVSTALGGAEALLSAEPDSPKIDLIWASGPELGATAIIAAALGEFGATPVIISDGPGDIDSRLAAAKYYPWSLVQPGLLTGIGDLDELLGRVRDQVTVNTSFAGLGAPFEESPVEARFLGAQAVAERLKLGVCWRKLQ